MLKGLGTRLEQLITFLVKGFWNEFKDGWEILWPIIWPPIRTAIRETIELIADGAEIFWKGFLNGWRLNAGLFNQVLELITKPINNTIKGGKGSYFDAMIGYINNGTYDPQIKDAIKKYLHQSNDIAELISFLGISPAVMSLILTAETQSYVLRTQQADLVADRPTPLDIGTIMQMWQREGVGAGALSDHLARNGYPESVSSWLDAATKQYLPLVQLAVAAQRQNGNTGALNEAATNLGFDNAQVQAAIIAAREIPPINMIALAAQKLGGGSGRVSEIARQLGYTDADAQAAIASVKGDSNLAMLAIAAMHGDVSAGLVSEAARKQGLPESDAQAALSAAKAFAPINLLALAVQRKGIARTHLDESAKSQGLEPNDVLAAVSAARTLLTPITLTEAMWRGQINEKEYVSKMGEAGYSEDDAKTFVSVAEFLPSPSDLISWISKEVFEDDSILKYGLDDEFDRLDLTLFAKIGINKEQAKNYWVSHWQHPSFTQVGEMFVRDILTDPQARNRVAPGSSEWAAVRAEGEAEVYEWFRLVEVPPYWRNRMIQMLYNPITRVDIRRMWDLDVASDDDVVRTYLDQGYRIEDAQKLLAFTKVERGFPDVVARYKNGWISEGDVLSELIAFGISPETATRLYQRKIKATEQVSRIAVERDLTKTEIISGIKKGLLGPENAIPLFIGLGYDEDEAAFLFLIHSEFTSSPDSPLGFRKGVEMYNKALGRPHIDIPDELIQLERKTIAAVNAIMDAKKQGAASGEIARLESEFRTLEATFALERKRLRL